MGFWQREKDVFVLGQTTPPFQYYLMREDKIDITLTSDLVVDQKIIPVSSSHGFTGAVGEQLVLLYGDLYMQTSVVSVSVDNITVQTRVTFPFPQTGTIVKRGNINMAIDGSSIPVDFLFSRIGVNAFTPIDLTTIKVTMIHATEGDMSMFGDQTALAEGLRILKGNGLLQGLGNYQTNGEFEEFGGKVTFPTKAGGGKFATNVEFDVRKVFGIELRLNPRIDDIFKGIVQDNINFGVGGYLHISLLGQFTLGE